MPPLECHADRFLDVACGSFRLCAWAFSTNNAAAFDGSIRVLHAPFRQHTHALGCMVGNEVVAVLKQWADDVLTRLET